MQGGLSVWLRLRELEERRQNSRVGGVQIVAQHVILRWQRTSVVSTSLIG